MTNPPSWLPDELDPALDPAAQKEEERLRALAAMDPFAADRYTALSGAQQAGRGLGRALGAGLGYDVRNPAEKKRDSIAEIKKSIATANVQPGSDDYFSLLISQFQKNGMVDAANAATQSWEALKTQRAQQGHLERSNQPKPASAKDRLTELYWQTTEALAQNPDDATLNAKKAALEKALGIKEAKLPADWQLVQPTQYSPGYLWNKSTGERKALGDRISKPGEGEQPESPFTGLTPEGRKAAEREAGKATALWVGGERATALKGVESLRDVQAALRANKDLVDDPWSTSLPDAVRATTVGGRAALQARDTVRSAIQSTLRATLGAQFTQQEGEALMNRAYDSRLGVKENVDRLERAILELEDKITAKDSLARGRRPEARPPREPREPRNSTVRVRFPDGSTGRIPRVNLDAAKENGIVEIK